MKVTYGYARVSTQEQNLDRQLVALKQLGIEDRNIITEKASGKDFSNRPNYSVLRNALLREGDTLVVKSLDRLSRNKADIKAELEYYQQHNIRVKILDLPTTLVDLPDGQNWVFDMVNNVLMEILASMAEQERLIIRQRQREGIAAARAKGQKFGRPQIEVPPDFKEIYAKVLAHELTATAAMQELELKRNTYYKFVHQMDSHL